MTTYYNWLYMYMTASFRMIVNEIKNYTFTGKI